MAKNRVRKGTHKAGDLPVDGRPCGSGRERLRYYLLGQSTSVPRYVIEQTLFFFCSWVPGLLGIGLRALAYKLILHSRGWPAIENGVRLCQPANLTLGKGVYLDHGVYLHACPQGIDIGANTYVMHNAEMHVYNFRGLEQAGITVGRNCIVGEYCVIRGQGGVRIGDNVIIAPHVQIMAVDHVFDDTTRPILAQGVRAFGIDIEDDVWIGASAVILDGVHIGRGAVVGAGAVVTGDVEPHTVVAGVPARLLRRLGRTRPPVRAPESVPELAQTARRGTRLA